MKIYQEVFFVGQYFLFNGSNQLRHVRNSIVTVVAICVSHNSYKWISGMFQLIAIITQKIFSHKYDFFVNFRDFSQITLACLLTQAKTKDWN